MNGQTSELGKMLFHWKYANQERFSGPLLTELVRKCRKRFQISEFHVEHPTLVLACRLALREWREGRDASKRVAALGVSQADYRNKWGGACDRDRAADFLERCGREFRVSYLKIIEFHLTRAQNSPYNSR